MTAGTGRLIRLALRRDRWVLPLWVLPMALLPAAYAASFRGLYPGGVGLREYHDSVAANPAMLSTVGPILGSSLGAVVAWRCGFLLALVGLAGLLTVVRHTRAEEDAGRRELLGAGAVGRLAPLAAALAVAAGALLALGAVAALALGAGGLPWPGAVALGGSFALAGLVFAAVGAVAAQLARSAGAARGVALGVLGAAYALRAAGDAAGPGGGAAWLSALSPLGWAQRVRPFAGERWWLLGALAAVAVLLAAGAAAVQARRDLGAGALPQRRGPAAAGWALRGPVGLAWRLHRASLLGWLAGLTLVGLVVGGASAGIDEMVASSRELGDLLPRLGGAAAMRDTYLAATAGIMALAAAGYAVSATLRLRAEESAGRAEPILATGLGRLRWAGSHLLFALGGPVLALLGYGVGSGLTAHDPGGALAAAAAQVPAVWVLAGVALAACGLLPRLAAGVAWGALGLCVLLSLVGALAGLDQWVLDLSPFAHAPRLPGGTAHAAPLLWLAGTAAALLAAGLAGLRRRDLAG
ncbi:hypothetical protein GCM10010123_35830 [Pilimelia anulata]|uniref:ABC transporter permease n=1 Tax=Pilimelia anulata TaxID=53371 RepID=A0A8J3BGV9_9ACTN|nr:ABC transporter permease [Pilimelia anulata]GGK02706.1 hypothetical protein GCM10010123_35830 [Pilimelia anulata]